MMNYNECDFITEFRGESANDYDTHLEYVEDGTWEKDYFANWLSHLEYNFQYPTLEEIEDFCKTTQYYLGHWFDGVEAGKIDPEAGRDAELDNLSFEELLERLTDNEKIEYYLSLYSDEEINDISKRLGCDYSYTTWEDAKVMIIEDYINAKKKGIIED